MIEIHRGNYVFCELSAAEANAILQSIIGHNCSIFSKMDLLENHICLYEPTPLPPFGSKKMWASDAEYINACKPETELETLNLIEHEDHLSGDIYIYTEDYSIDEKILFKIHRKNLNQFVSEFNTIYKQHFFTDRTIFISPDTSKIIMYFHEVWWFLYNLPLSIPAYLPIRNTIFGRG